MSDGYHGVPWADIEVQVRVAGIRHGAPFGELQDHTQDAIERLLLSRGPRSDERRTVMAYAYKVGVYTAKDKARARQSRPWTTPLMLNDEDPWLHTRDRGFEVVEALDLIRRLSRTDQEALMAAFLVGDGVGATHRTMVGEMLGVSQDAAHQRISRARTRARRAA